MERISGKVGENSGEESRFGRYILQSFDKNTFVLSSKEVDVSAFLNKPVEAEGYRTRTMVGKGKIAFVVTKMTSLEEAGSSGIETSEGVLKRLEVTSFQYGTHGLYDTTGKILFALQSTILNLDIYVGHTVVVAGYPLIDIPIEGGPINLQVTDVYIPLRINPSKPFDVKLRGNYTTGYTWKLEDISDSPVVELVKENYVVDSEETIGSGGTAIFTFLAKSIGKTSLTFINSRSWQKEDIYRKIKYLVMVA